MPRRRRRRSRLQLVVLCARRLRLAALRHPQSRLPLYCSGGQSVKRCVVVVGPSGCVTICWRLGVWLRRGQALAVGRWPLVERHHPQWQGGASLQNMCVVAHLPFALCRVSVIVDAGEVEQEIAVVWFGVLWRTACVDWWELVVVNGPGLGAVFAEVGVGIAHDAVDLREPTELVDAGQCWGVWIARSVVCPLLDHIVHDGDFAVGASEEGGEHDALKFAVGPYIAHL